MFYHKCFASQSFFPGLLTHKELQVWIFDDRKSWGFNKFIGMLLKIIFIINSLFVKHVDSNIYVASFKIEEIVAYFCKRKKNNYIWEAGTINAFIIEIT